MDIWYSTNSVHICTVRPIVSSLCILPPTAYIYITTPLQYCTYSLYSILLYSLSHTYDTVRTVYPYPYIYTYHIPILLYVQSTSTPIYTYHIPTLLYVPSTPITIYTYHIPVVPYVQYLIHVLYLYIRSLYTYSIVRTALFIPCIYDTATNSRCMMRAETK